MGPGGQPFVVTRNGTLFWPDALCPSNAPIIPKPTVQKEEVQFVELASTEEDESAFDDDDDYEVGGF